MRTIKQLFKAIFKYRLSSVLTLISLVVAFLGIIVLSLWTILLALTGLLGLIVFISRDKVKEIGIRKVNGASIFEVVHLLNKNVLIWLSIAFVIATSFAWYFMNQWLVPFALSWWIFAFAGLAALIVALLTVSWQSWRAATRNPVEALRYE
ncbi:MAG: FtsX-like permease family protein [Petrimonas sp.]|nr:FtsX-like permease family protein [Petrimonas sp.]